LVAAHCAPVTFYRGIVRGKQLGRDHAFEFISGLNALQGIYRSMALPSAVLGV
jgi:hypothetical protein